MKRIAILAISSLIFVLMSSPAMATAPIIATTSTIANGAVGPFNVVITGTNFKTAGVFLTDLTIGLGTTGLNPTAVSTLGSGNEIRISFEGTAVAGTLTIQAKTTAFAPTSVEPSKTLSIFVPGFLVTTVGATTAGFAKTFNITATTNGSTTDTGYTGSKTVAITSSDTGATLGTINTFSAGVGAIAVTFSAPGNFTVTARETAGGTLVGTSASITVDPAIASTSVIQIGTTNPTVTLTTTKDLKTLDPLGVSDFEYNFGTTGLTTALSLSRVSNREVIITFSPGPVTAGTLKIKAKHSAFAFGTTSVASNELSFTATAAPPSSGGGGGGASAPVVVAPVVPVVAPGARVSGTKWSVVTGADGITRARVSVGTQFRGKNAVFFKGLKNGKLVRVGTGKVGRAGRANLQTRVKFKEGQKIRVQVDERFRSTITINN